MIGNKIQPFKIWCQKVLPNVYDDSLSYYEYLCKMNEYLNEVIEQMNTLTEAEEDFQEAMNSAWDSYKTNLNGEWADYKDALNAVWAEYKNYIDNYFANLDVQQEINNKLDVMASDGTLDALLLPYFNAYKTEINQIVATQNGKIDVLEGRVDEITTLPSGSTSGDAELADIRVPQATFNGGSNYANAGDAVRGQVGTLQTYVGEQEVLTFNALNLLNYHEFNLGEFLQGYFENNKFWSDNSQITTHYLKLPKGMYKITTNGSFGVVYNEYTLGNTGIQRTTHYTNASYILANHSDETKYVTFGLYGSGVEPTDGSSIQITYWTERSIITKEEIQNELNMHGFVSLKGTFLGAYGETGAISSSSSQASYCGLVEVPKDCYILAKTRITGTTMYLRAYTYANGTYTRVLNSSQGDIARAVATGDRYYSFLINKSSSIGAFTDDDYDFWIVNKNQMVYYNENNTTLHILWNNTDYVIYHQVNASINLDSWRFYRGISEGITLWEDSDAEGPIKLVGDSDFIGGYHGDEVVSDIKLLFDETELDMSVHNIGIAKLFEMYQTSTCYKADTNTPAFTRNKKLTISNGNFDVQQKWTALIDCTIDRGALCLFQAPKTNNKGWDTETWLPRHGVDGTTSLYGATIANMYIGTRKFSLIAEYGQQFDGFHASVDDFGGRIKFYLDMYNGKELNVGDVINSKFKVVINDV